jgi:hypothetical protein
MQSTTYIRVFISCPSNDEILRELPLELISIAKDVSRTYERLGFTITPLYWSLEAFAGSEAGRTPQQIIDERVGDYDLYFGMMGSRYGNIDPDNGISPTEHEFNYALTMQKKSAKQKHPRIVCFSFMDMTKGDCENDQQYNRVIEFRQRAWAKGISHVSKKQGRDKVPI